MTNTSNETMLMPGVRLTGVALPLDEKITKLIATLRARVEAAEAELAIWREVVERLEAECGEFEAENIRLRGTLERIRQSANVENCWRLATKALGKQV